MMRAFQAGVIACLRSKYFPIFFISFLLVYTMIFWLWHRAQKAEEQYRQAVVLQKEQVEQVEALGKALHISQMNSKELQAAYEALKHRPPASSFTVQAPSLNAAAEQVAARINKQDASLPPVALEKSDRTAVVTNDGAYKVDVLKINLDKAWEVSVGVGIHRGDAYIPVGVQRNYASHKAISAEVHLSLGELASGSMKPAGWDIKHVWRFK